MAHIHQWHNRNLRNHKNFQQNLKEKIRTNTMSKTNQNKPSSSESKPKLDLSTKIDIGKIKGGQHVSEANPKPVPPPTPKENKKG